MTTDYYMKAATRLFLSLKSTFGHDAKMREEDIKLIADALGAAGGRDRHHTQQDPVNDVDKFVKPA